MGKMRMMNGGAGSGAGAGGMSGIAGSGIMGHIMTGSVIQCKAEDTTMFCTLSKIVNGLILLLILIGILYLVYYLFKQFVWNKRGGGLTSYNVDMDEKVGGYVYSKSRKSRKMRTKTQ